MVFPGMVYISHPTEYGTLYSKSELEELCKVCKAISTSIIYGWCTIRVWIDE